MLNQITPRIYVACLGAYNSGHLHGKWIEANQGIEIIWEEIHAILKSSPEPHSEEWAIHDSEFLGHVREYHGIDDIFLRADFIATHGEIALALLDYHYETQDAINAMEGYHGEYDSELDFAYRLFEDTRDSLYDDSFLVRYFNYESFARDLFLGDYYSIKDGNKCYVFSNN